MLFDVWGSDTLIHWAGWAMVFIGLIVLNEVGRRTKLGAAIIFGVAPLAMTIYCVAIAVGVSQGAEWALTNPTHVYQNSWFPKRQRPQPHIAEELCISTGTVKKHLENIFRKTQVNSRVGLMALLQQYTALKQ